MPYKTCIKVLKFRKYASASLVLHYYRGRSLAEWGSVGLLERELRQRGPVLRSIVKAAGLWHPRLNQNTSATFSVDRKRHLLSLASMFGR